LQPAQLLLQPGQQGLGASLRRFGFDRPRDGLLAFDLAFADELGSSACSQSLPDKTPKRIQSKAWDGCRALRALGGLITHRNEDFQHFSKILGLTCKVPSMTQYSSIPKR
jgi:hypothetical protein